jgi:hypothetical protein
MVKTYDCTSGGAQWCQGCYTMEESTDVQGNPDGYGDWVAKSDYDALAAELEQAKARVIELSDMKPATLRQRVQELEAALREVYEVYAGSDGFVPETAPEAYQERLIKQMAQIAAATFTKETKDEG